jgi:hydroxymethylglutaryl-CoA lyase
MVGNLPTELLLAELRRLGAELPAMRPLDGLVAASREIERKFGVKVQ